MLYAQIQKTNDLNVLIARTTLVLPLLLDSMEHDGKFNNFLKAPENLFVYRDVMHISKMLKTILTENNNWERYTQAVVHMKATKTYSMYIFLQHKSSKGVKKWFDTYINDLEDINSRYLNYLSSMGSRSTSRATT